MLPFFPSVGTTVFWGFWILNNWIYVAVTDPSVVPLCCCIDFTPVVLLEVKTSSSSSSLPVVWVLQETKVNWNFSRLQLLLKTRHKHQEWWKQQRWEETKRSLFFHLSSAAKTFFISSHWCCYLGSVCVWPQQNDNNYLFYTRRFLWSRMFLDWI